MKASVNTKEYERSQRGVESCFFDTLEKYGGDGLCQLMLYDNDSFKQERIFYIKLRGEISEEKRFILNKCLIKKALKWRNRKPGKKTFRKQYQPSTWDTLLKYLFSIFRCKNIVYNYATDFNGEGKFHGVLATTWAKEMEEDPEFTTGVNTATCDMNADFKNDSQRKTAKAQMLQESALYQSLTQNLADITDKYNRVDINLQLVKNNFTVAKLEMRERIAKMETLVA